MQICKVTGVIFVSKHLRFWGTSGGTGVPSPFCRCAVCENARSVGGKEIRSRSAFRINSKVMIDIGEDYVSTAAKLKDDLFEVEHFLFTHTHSDHFNYRFFWSRRIGAKMPQNPVTVYFADEAFEYISKKYGTENNVIFKRLKYGETYKIEDIEVTPLKGMHSTENEKYSANYLIKLQDGRLLYYGVDSGYYIEETFDFLKNYKLDIFISECTYPRERPIEESVANHMDVSRCVENMDKLYENGTIDKDTLIYLTHIDCRGMNHSQLEAYFSVLERDYSVNIAYDGLCIK